MVSWIYGTWAINGLFTFRATGFVHGLRALVWNTEFGLKLVCFGLGQGPL